MSEQENRFTERLSKLMPFSEDIYVRMAIDMADAFAAREGLPAFSETSKSHEFTVAPSPFTADVVVVIVHTQHFPSGAQPLEVQVALGNVDIFTSGSVTATDFRVCFYPFLNAPADRHTTFALPSVDVATEVDSYIAFAADETAAQASVVAAFHEAWFTQTGSSDFSVARRLVESEVVATACYQAAELASLPVGSIAVSVPLMDDTVEAFMDLLVSRSFLGLRFSRVSNPARADDGYRQVGNILFLHALPL